MSTTTVTLRGREWDVKYHDHGYEPDTNAHEIDWEFTEADAPKDISAEEEMVVLDQLYEIGPEPRLDDDVI